MDLLVCRRSLSQSSDSKVDEAGQARGSWFSEPALSREWFLVALLLWMFLPCCWPVGKTMRTETNFVPYAPREKFLFDGCISGLLVCARRACCHIDLTITESVALAKRGSI